MDISNARKIFDQLYFGVDGIKIAKESASKLPYKYVANIYGEVTFDSFYQILKEVKPLDGDVFYDLGSGTGKPGIIAYLCFNFSKIIGIEKSKELYTISKNLLAKLGVNKVVKLDFVNSDFKEYNFFDADIIFMNSYTYFYYEIYNNFFFKKLSKLKKGTRLITTKMPIYSSLFKIEEKGPFRFSWGDEFIYLHKV